MRPANESSRARRGIALAELLVAVVLLAVGVLSLAGVTASLLRADSAARRASQAALQLSDRVERVVRAPCVVASGVATSRGVVERWSTVSVDSAARLVDSVSWTDPVVGVHVVGLDVPVWCVP